MDFFSKCDQRGLQLMSGTERTTLKSQKTKCNMEPTSKPTCSPSSQFTDTLEKKQVIDLASGQFSPFCV